MEKTTRKEGTAIIFIVAIVLGSLATSWYYSTYKTDDSWVDTAN